MISFTLNGSSVTLDDPKPTQTVLDWLREVRGLTGTKEGCNEGDCGACTVMITDADGPKALNACILFLPQLNGKELTTVEGLNDDHPVQTAMVKHHGSQCGFCTPGFIMSMATAHANGDTNHDDALAGNLCRCTGYAPIIRAAQDAQNTPAPTLQKRSGKCETVTLPDAFIPQTSDELAAWYAMTPHATLVGGATDVGLWVNKDLRDISPIAFVSQIADLQQIEQTDAGLTFGAAVTITNLMAAIKPFYPSFAEMLRRYGSTQVRNAATIGGNIANGSPIGDSPPALIALDATLTLRHGDTRRTMPLEKFFIEYGKQDRQAGEFVESVFIPTQVDTLKCYKLSKRFDQDISAVCGCFNIQIAGGKVVSASIAFGGMAGTPKRAKHVEDALTSQEWSDATFRAAMKLFPKDYQPMSDMRASDTYRMHTAQNMLLRYFLEYEGTPTNVLEVTL